MFHQWLNSPTAFSFDFFIFPPLSLRSVTRNEIVPGTTCPNSSLRDVSAHHGALYDPKQPYNSEPLALDVETDATDR